jgi:hypothetical protein
MKMRTLADSRRLAGRTATIGTVRSRRSEETMTVPSLSSAAKEPCWRLGNPKMFKDTHPHLFNIAGPKDSVE